MKIIDLLNMISKGEELPKKIRIDHWSYKFEWVEHESNYYDKQEDIDLMSCLSCDKEELNYEVHEIEVKKIPEKLNMTYMKKIDDDAFIIERFSQAEQKIVDTVNALIDYLKSKGE